MAYLGHDMYIAIIIHSPASTSLGWKDWVAGAIGVGATAVTANIPTGILAGAAARAYLEKWWNSSKNSGEREDNQEKDED